MASLLFHESLRDEFPVSDDEDHDEDDASKAGTCFPPKLDMFVIVASVFFHQLIWAPFLSAFKDPSSMTWISALPLVDSNQ